MCLTLSISEMPNRLKDKESGVFVDIWLTDKLLTERRESQQGSGENGTQEGAALLARGTRPGEQSHSVPLFQIVYYGRGF